MRSAVTSTPHKSRKTYRRYVPMLAGGGLFVIVVLLAVLVIRNFLDDNDEPKKHRVQQISLIKPPEPPPPPPEVKPPEEKPPEIKEEIPQDKPPEPVATDQPPPGIGGNGYGKGDTSFGGRGGWMGGAGRFGYYLGGVQKDIHDELNRNEKLHKKAYKVEVALWIAKSGTISRFELMGTSGDKDMDAAIRKSMLGARFEEPPSDIPQPIRLRISSR